MKPTRSFRILLTLWFRKWAGDPRAVEELAIGLRARGHAVLVACPADGVLGRRLRAGNVPMADLDFGKGWNLRSARALDALVRDRGIELVDTHAAGDRKAALLARWIFRTPARLVITRRAMSGTFPPLNRVYAASADRIVAISRGVADTLTRGGTPVEKISVVHTGIDPARLGKAPDAAALDAIRREFGLNPALPVVGMLARRKNQETLLRAATLLGRPLNLLFVGIERDASLAALEATLPAGTRIGYAGFREPILPFYHVLDVKVLATRSEGLSQAILESMAVGVPVISAAVGGTPEVIAHERNGLLFPPEDAAALAGLLGRLLDDSALRAHLVREGRATVGGYFHTSCMVERTEAVYHELLENDG